MSRYYDLYVIVQNAEPNALRKIIDGFHDSLDYVSLGQSHHYCGKTWLVGGQSEEEAHEELSTAIKKAFRNALVRTHWTYLDELPHEEYGDAFDD